MTVPAAPRFGPWGAAVAALAVGCQGGAGAKSGGGPGTDSGGHGGVDSGADTGPSPYVHSPDAPPEAPAPAAVEAALGQAVAAFAALGPGLVFGAQDAALDQASGSCPGLFPAVGLTTGWSADCSTSAGWGFDGRGQAAWLSDVTVDGVRLNRYGTFITTTTFTHPGGATLVLDGRGDYAVARAGETLSLSAALSGTFGAATGDAPWLDLAALGGAPSVSAQWEGGATGADRWLRLEGGLSGGAAAGDEGLGLRFDGLELREEAGVCTATGTVVALMADGARVALPLDGAPCSACGPATDAAGRAVGELCVDLTPLWQPEEWAW